MSYVSIEQYLAEYFGLHGKISLSFPDKNDKRNDVWNLYKYNENCYKIVYFKRKNHKNNKKSTINGTQRPLTTERLSQSISRAKATVFEIALCNDFNYFCTFTQDEKMRDRFDLAKFRKDFAQFVRDENKKRSPQNKIKYLLIPEQHQNGAWHMHGLLCGLDKNDLVKNEYGYLDWKKYRNKFGFFSVSKIKNKTACCKYITKYVTKEFTKNAIESGNHLFFASQGLRRKECLFYEELENCPLSETSKWDFENEYVRIKWFEQSEKQKFKKSS